MAYQWAPTKLIDLFHVSGYKFTTYSPFRFKQLNMFSLALIRAE